MLQSNVPPGTSPFQPQHIELGVEDEGYTDEEQDVIAPKIPSAGMEGDMPDRMKHRTGRPPQWAKPPPGKVAPMFRQQLWKLESNRAKMRRLVRRIAKPP